MKHTQLNWELCFLKPCIQDATVLKIQLLVLEVLVTAGNLCLFIILHPTGAIPALMLALLQLLKMYFPDTRREETGICYMAVQS